MSNNEVVVTTGQSLTNVKLSQNWGFHHSVEMLGSLICDCTHFYNSIIRLSGIEHDKIFKKFCTGMALLTSCDNKSLSYLHENFLQALKERVVSSSEIKTKL
jgi:hypothetical protein